MTGTRAFWLVEHLRSGGLRLGVAESLTGGLLASAIVNVPGASAVFRGGIVAYDSAVKTSVLAVDPRLIAECGVVSEPVARSMAAGARRVLGADLGVATTGVAGPGAQAGVPAGTVCLAVDVGGDVQSQTVSLPGDRGAVREAAAEAALAFAVEILERRRS